MRSQVACRYTQGLSAHTHKSVTPTCENWVTCGDTQGLSVHTFMLPRPMRSQVACEDALYDNLHIFRRQKCLQSLHAFKCDNVLTHFEDKSVISHCMPSKATINLIYISKTTMSSVIVCLQRRQYPHLHFKDDNVFSHCMPSKEDNVFICILKTTMSSPQKLRYLFPLCFVGLDVLCLYALKKRVKMKMN